MKIKASVLCERTARRIESLKADRKRLEDSHHEARGVHSSIASKLACELQDFAALIGDKCPDAFKYVSRYGDHLVALDFDKLTSVARAKYKSVQALTKSLEEANERLEQACKDVTPTPGRGKYCPPSPAFEIDSRLRDLQQLLDTINTLLPSEEIQLSTKLLAKIFPELA